MPSGVINRGRPSGVINRGRPSQVANTRHCSLFIALYSITMTCCSCCHIVKVTTSVITGVKQGVTAASQVDSTDVRSTSTPVAVMTELSHEYSVLPETIPDIFSLLALTGCAENLLGEMENYTKYSFISNFVGCISVCIKICWHLTTQTQITVNSVRILD